MHTMGTQYLLKITISVLNLAALSDLGVSCIRPYTKNSTSSGVYSHLCELQPPRISLVMNAAMPVTGRVVW